MNSYIALQHTKPSGMLQSHTHYVKQGQFWIIILSPDMIMPSEPRVIRLQSRDLIAINQRESSRDTCVCVCLTLDQLPMLTRVVLLINYSA